MNDDIKFSKLELSFTSTDLADPKNILAESHGCDTETLPFTNRNS